MNTIDIDTWEPRKATRKENYDGVTVCDALENVHFLCCYCPYFGFEGVPSAMAILESVAAKIRNSTKAQWTGYQGPDRFVIDLALAAGVELLGTLTASPPLTFYSDGLESVFHYVEAFG